MEEKDVKITLLKLWKTKTTYIVIVVVSYSTYNNVKMCFKFQRCNDLFPSSESDPKKLINKREVGLMITTISFCYH